ncbi:MAG TPA: hypothetical protein VHX44_03520 [Planctomycetota bacterium]|jgi:hypothetical protein|nr:hypothetical protein [Planctomycetota bacterium]
MGDTDRHSRNGMIRNISIASGAAVLAVVVPAAVTWATDRAELHAGTDTNRAQEATLKDHQTKLDDLSRGAAVRDANDANMRVQLEEIRRQLDKIADKLGAAKP